MFVFATKGGECLNQSVYQQVFSALDKVRRIARGRGHTRGSEGYTGCTKHGSCFRPFGKTDVVGIGLQCGVEQLRDSPSGGAHHYICPASASVAVSP